MARNRAKQHAFAITAADQTLLPADNQRQSIVFSAPDAGRYTVMFGEVAVLGSGITIFTGSNPFTLTREQIGDVITAPVHVIGSGAIGAGALTVSGA